MSRAPKSATIKYVSGGCMIAKHSARSSCIAVLLIIADYFDVSLVRSCRYKQYNDVQAYISSSAVRKLSMNAYNAMATIHSRSEVITKK